ncbi:hypothetical protein E2L07_14560 [Halalkalibacterium halodurans]|uniref:hypothetical protein n=1 Tax=Halalkalibacterium halodurans TaxID=86665 RepID=UPI001067975B|nr:hypothetical protein [Halalkalibacterium halodurans]TES52124.1 hypothetical protein E2L07_14560 [Halalkalibacterium halodurans]
MGDLCRKVPDHAVQIIKERCRVVNLCHYITPTSTFFRNDNRDQEICEIVRKAAAIWCGAGIEFNVNRIEELQHVLTEPPFNELVAEDFPCEDHIGDH